MIPQTNQSEDSLGGNSKIVWWKRSLFQVIAASLLGAGLGGPGYRAWQDPRHDPITGRQVEALEARLAGKIEAGDYAIKLNDDKMERRLDRQDVRLNSLTAIVSDLPPDDLVERVTRTEEKIKNLERSCVKWVSQEPVLQ